ncbi:hypothetical protein AAFC00_002670 [Neodothiora populina]|uniref:Uncharacterized protein n=1 Tax=Neodothiora populina TaxID=2781224 RepID=A0ABR3P7T7_9PEZI
MKFNAVVFGTALLASSVMAIPAASAEPGLVRAGKFGNWCVAPGQMCYKTKRDLDDAKTIIAAGFEAPNQQEIEKRGLVRAGRFGNWCVAPGQMCYKSKRDYDEAITDIAAGYDAPHPDEIEKRSASPEPKKGGLVRAGRFGNWCVAPGQMCYKSKRDLDEVTDAILAGFEAPTPDEIEKRSASPEPKKGGLVRAGKFGNWCVAPGQMCYKSKRDLEVAKSHVAVGDYAPLPEDFE